MPNIFMPQLPQGSSFTPNPQRIGMMKNLAESLGVMVEEAKKQQQYKHETSIVEQIAAGQPVTGTRSQEPRTGWQGITDPFNPNAPYSGQMSPLEMEYTLAPAMEARESRKGEAVLQRSIRLKQAGEQAKRIKPTVQKMSEIDTIKYRQLQTRLTNLKKEKADTWTTVGRRSAAEIGKDIANLDKQILAIETKYENVSSGVETFDSPEEAKAEIQKRYPDSTPEEIETMYNQMLAE